MSRPQTKRWGEGEEQQGRKKGTRLTNSFLQSARFCLSAQTQLQASAQTRWRRLLFLEKKKGGWGLRWEGGGEGGGRGRGQKTWSVCPKTSGRMIPPPSTTRQGPHSRAGWGRGRGEVG